MEIKPGDILFYSGDNSRFLEKFQMVIVGDLIDDILYKKGKSSTLWFQTKPIIFEDKKPIFFNRKKFITQIELRFYKINKIKENICLK